MRYVFVPAEEAEQVKRDLIEKDVLIRDAPVLREEDRIGFAVVADVDGYESEERSVEYERAPRSLKEALRERIGDQADDIKRAFDVIGDIAIIESTRGVDDELIADALLTVHKNVKAVYVKDGGHEGEFRLQEYRWLAGEKRTHTVHKENGYELELDIADSYFSPRVAGERLRIAQLVEDDERVLVLGSGVAPYGVCIEVHAEPHEVTCVEFNEQAHEWALRNVERNKLTRTKPVHADAKAFLETARLDGEFYDRIIMPLPAQSKELLPLAWAVKKQGGMVHYYTFLDETGLENPAVPLEGAVIAHVEKVGQSAPNEWRVCLDLK